MTIMIRKIPSAAVNATTETQAPVTPVATPEVTVKETTTINKENEGEKTMSTPMTAVDRMKNMTAEEKAVFAEENKRKKAEKEAKDQNNYTAVTVNNDLVITALSNKELVKTFSVKGHSIEAKYSINSIIDSYRKSEKAVTKDDMARLLELAGASIIDVATTSGKSVRLENDSVKFTIKNVYRKGVRHSVAALIQKPVRFLTGDLVRLTTTEFED